MTFMSSQNYFKTWQLIGDEMTEGEREETFNVINNNNDSVKGTATRATTTKATKTTALIKTSNV